MSIASQIHIVPLDFDNEKLLNKLSLSLEQAFGIPTSILGLDILLKKGWSLERDQLNSTWVLTQLLAKAPDDSSKLLGVTVYDLYTPILTYLFGEAELGGRVAVFSIYRFQDELYGMPASNENLTKRFLKEAVHELGHTFGLVHCRHYDCVMHATSYIEEFDFKTDCFCESCVSLLEERMKT